MRSPDIPVRIIPCLDVHDGRVVKGQQFLNLQDAGDPVELAEYYESGGADEIVFLDISATNESRGTVTDRVEAIARNIFIPFTVGGGIRSVADAQVVLDNGADKVAVNSAAIEDPSLLSDLARHVGRQSVVLSIDAKQSPEGTTWEVYTAGGSKPTGKDVVTWAEQGVGLGAGEILITSIDQDGENSGYNLELLEKIAAVVKVPLIASGGAGEYRHFSEAAQIEGVDALLCASALHRGNLSIATIKDYLSNNGIKVRPLDERMWQDFKAGQDQQRPRLAIVDYGMGNRYSISAALERVGASVVVTEDPKEILMSDGMILPGVGAFPAAMNNLEEQDLVGTLNQFRKLGKPILGICLGYQLLFDGSEEQEETTGLGWVSGRVAEVDTVVSPNIGWRTVDLVRSTLTKGLNEEELFYHVHQFAPTLVDEESVKGVTTMGKTNNGRVSSATSIVKDGNVSGTQFHPEKSSYAGLALLANFVDSCR
ncbi:MAG: imidazole glycerol phosphate synthase subunit HisF [Candidatus Saccharimonadales bacterium]